jgi:hypothetical protein
VHDLIIVKAQRKLEARLARLAHDQLRRADHMHITDAHTGLIQPLDREILTDPSGNEECRMLRKVRPPPWVVRHRVPVHSFVDPAMHPKVRLFIPFQAQPAHAHGTLHGIFDKATGHALRSQRARSPDANGQH